MTTITEQLAEARKALVDYLAEVKALTEEVETLKACVKRLRAELDKAENSTK